MPQTIKHFMKKLIFTVALAYLMMSQTAFAQRTCAVMDHHQKLVEQDPQIQFNLDQINQFTEEFIRNGGGITNKVAVNIPVVVHVLYNTSTQNISDAQIQSQLTVLNADFKKQNTDWSKTPSIYSGLVADCELSFCLATKDPNGNTTSGIIRKSTTKTVFDAGTDDAKYNSTGGSDAWPAGSYLNIWVVPSIKSGTNTGILGYAQFPGGPAATDGLVICHNYFGTTGTVTAPFNKGRTGTHEIGHWLNLYHIWGDDGTSCTGSDQCADTPNQADENYGTPSFPQYSCSNDGDMHMNYMDYVDDAAMYMFTTGQKARMQALFASGGARVSLLTSNGCGGGTATTPSYCSANATNVSYEWIANVTLGSINNTTTANGGYGDFTNLSTNLTPGSSYSISLKPGFASSTYTEYFKVYIDYNNDKDFDDAGENVYTSAGTTSTVTASFTVPSTATAAATRMRVIMKDGSISSPCGSFTYGEVEDYTVNIVVASTCNAPTGLSVGSIATTSATISWTAVSGASNYTVQIKPSTSSTWTSLSASGNSLNVTGLTAGTTYNWQVRTNCSGGSSAYTTGSNFTTSSSTSCSDAYETNNSLSAAKSITVNTNIKALIGTSTDVDWFKFSNTSTNKNIRVTLSTLPADYDLYLYNSSGTLLYKSENGSTTSETIKYNNAPVATYYVLVKGYNSAFNSSTCYTVNASVSSTAFKQMEEEEITTAKVDETIFTIMPNPSVDGRFTFNLSNPVIGDVHVDVYDQSGRLVYNELLQKGEEFLKSGIDLSEKNKGMYIVKIYNDTFHVTERILFVK